MLKAVVFDIDNTLYSYDAAHAAAWSALKAYAGETLGLSPERFEALHTEAIHTQAARAGGPCAAVHNRLIRCQLMLESGGLPIFHAPRMARLYWSVLLDNAQLSPGADEALNWIRSRGLTVGIGTNMTADYQFAKLERLGLTDRVDFLVTSEEVGAEKPDRRLFDCCAQKAGCPPEACVFTGDSLKGDVLGALGAGMRAVWLCPAPVDPSGVPPGAALIRTLDELPALLSSF